MKTKGFNKKDVAEWIKDDLANIAYELDRKGKLK
jgi:hypothetical protein